MDAHGDNGNSRHASSDIRGTTGSETRRTKATQEGTDFTETRLNCSNTYRPRPADAKIEYERQDTASPLPPPRRFLLPHRRLLDTLLPLRA